MSVLKQGTKLTLSCSGKVGSPSVAQVGSYAKAMSADVAIPGTLAFSTAPYLTAGISDKYFAVKFVDGGPRYGWLLVEYANGTNIKITDWGYQNDGSSIMTLADSIATRKLALADGRTKLHWTNDNENGVARYEV